jgi:DNA modification methylase
VAGFDDSRDDWTEAWQLSPSDVAYCWHAPQHASSTQDALEAANFEIRTQIVWTKQTFVISRGHYHGRHEPCWYAVRKGATARWIGDHSQSTVWDITWDRNVEGGHSTQKPVECMARPIRNHEGDVYDPFVGSGTTLIAAEYLDRRCYALEIQPAYCDVVVRRWERVSGRQAVQTHP